MEDSKSAEEKDKGKANGQEHFGEWAAKLTAGGHMYHAAGIGGVCLVELVDAAFFVGEGFDGSDAGKGFFEECEEVAETGLSFGSTAAQVAPYDADKPYGERHHDEEVEEESWAYEYEYGGEDDNVDRVFAEGDDGGEYPPFYVGEVVGHAANNVAPASGVEIGDWEDGYLFVEVVAETHNNAVAQGTDDELCGVAAEVGEE